MDAFAVAICAGLTMKKVTIKKPLVVGLYFGIFQAVMPLALATSIDALAVGISMLGVKIGNVFGARFKSKAELAGGVILALIGLEIWLEHLSIIRF
jgi:putative Mn2+ efflux pump MntP